MSRWEEGGKMKVRTYIHEPVGSGVKVGVCK